MATLRLFIAIEIPSEIKAQFVSLIRELKSTDADVRWDSPEKLHITLKFLGDTREEQLPEINLKLGQIAAQFAPFVLRYSGIGCFPNNKEPRIIWGGVEDLQNAISPIVESIELSMSILGFEREKRKFHPHVTIGRIKSQRNIRGLLRTMESTTLESHTTNVSHLILVRSTLKPAGSEYSTIRTFQLSGTQSLNQ